MLGAGMSMCVLGMAGEFADYSVAVNALWPRTAIDTAAVQNLLGGGEVVQHSRLPSIMADSAWCISFALKFDYTLTFCSCAR
jgi:citronellol/citronellal dehydrogenase